MKKLSVGLGLLLCLALSSGARAQDTKAPNVIAQVRAAIAKNDFAGGEKILGDYRAAKGGWTPEALEALSWLGRGALAAKQFDKADGYARETHKLAVAELATRALDAEKNLPIALGAAIEVQAHASAERGARSEAVAFLQRELETYKATSIRTRIQKNINLLTLEGKPAPAYEVSETLGGKVPTIAELKGRPAILFFWAHWCPDCKGMAPALAKLHEMYKGKGLAIIAPTQRYGYGTRGVDLTPAEELVHIENVKKESYGTVPEFAVPVGEETFKVYGCSTTPTVVLVDRQGVVQLYHPGKMTFEELEPKVRALVETSATAAR